MRLLTGSKRLALFALLAASASAFARPECRFSADRNFDVDAAGVKALQLVLGPHDARLEGVAAGNRIEVRGKACASDEAYLKDLDVQHERSGDRVRISAERDNPVHMNLFGTNYAYLQLDIRLPQSLLVELQTGSGDADVTNVAALRYGAGSGDLKARHIAGEVSVRVGSGDVIIDDLGSLAIERVGSGDIHATNVRGEVTVGNVGSGDLRLADVKGGVRVDSVGSGDVNVERAGGTVEVGSIGSGDVTVDEVGGDFVVHNAGSGDLRHHRVSGKVQVPRRHEDD